MNVSRRVLGVLSVLLLILAFPPAARSQGPLQKATITYSSRSIASIDLFNERGSSEILARYLNVDFPTALETYRLSRPAYTTDGIPSDGEVREHLKMDAQILGLAEPVPPSKVFDFSLQREVNQELGVK